MFWICYGLIHDVNTSFMISFVETMHDASRSKHMITLGNKIEVLKSYFTRKRSDYYLAAMIIKGVSEEN